MKASEVRKVERKLGITLPGPYLQFLLNYAEVRDTWRGKESARPFPHKIMFLPDELIDANIEFRANPTKLVAPNFLKPPAGACRYFLMGWKGGPMFLDLTKKNCKVHLTGGDRRLYAWTEIDKIVEWTRAQYEGLNWGQPRLKPDRAAIRLSSKELLKEIQPLIRDSVLLRPEGTEYIAYWNDQRIRPPAGGDYEHLISVDVRAWEPAERPSQWKTGCVHLFAKGTRSSAKLVYDASATLPKSGRGKLYADRTPSLPPIEAVFRFGSDRIQQWLKSNGWEPHRVYARNFPDLEPTEAYIKRWRKQHPYFNVTTGIAAVIGGWPRVWGTDFPKRATQQLMIWTLRDAEPFWEVYRNGSKLQIVDRIT